ncbi:DnaJ domain [Quillaja saponaria]|uniref:DnaJ domain n=1 Tax=Quillaja saponaria TaxID=32244 RepID=A0AAD7PKF5_QUISA|nr:DnaJ domain [Quillaja saponaria]
MLLDKYSAQETHYEILNVKEDANYEEIRTSYRNALLNSHPDKLIKTPEASDPDKESRERFLKVQKAWEILSNSSSRVVYDSELRGSRQDIITAEAAEALSLDNMMVEEAGEALELFYQCRCGDYFSIDSLELSKMGYPLMRNGAKISLQNSDTLPASILLPCGSCSLQACLLISSDRSSSNDEHFEYIVFNFPSVDEYSGPCYDYLISVCLKPKQHLLNLCGSSKSGPFGPWAKRILLPPRKKTSVYCVFRCYRKQMQYVSCGGFVLSLSNM